MDLKRTPVLCMGLALAAGAAWAAETIVARDERLVIDDAVPALSEQDALFISPHAASVTKVGPGIWTLPLANSLGFSGGGFALDLQGGTLRLAPGAAPDYVAEPPDVLQEAALWLTAERNVSEDPVTGVTGWYDAREASASATRYGYAAQNAGVPTGQKGVTNGVFRGRPALCFGQYVGATFRSLELKTASGAPTAYDMRDAFYVMGLDPQGKDANAFSPVLGNSEAGFFFTNPGKRTVLSADGNAHWRAYQCICRRNGVEADPTVPLEIGPSYLCAFTTQNGLSVSVNALSRDRNLASGGGCVHEVVIFERTLSAVERARVTAYLMQKWAVPTAARVCVNMADGTVVAPDEAALLQNVDLVGSVTLGLPPGPYAHMRDDVPQDRPWRYRLGDASVLNAEGTEYRLALRDGEAVTVDDSSDLVRTVSSVLADPAGEVSVTGARRALVLDRLPVETKRLTVSSGAGDVVLRAPPAAVRAQGAAARLALSPTPVSIPAGTEEVSVPFAVPKDGDWELSFGLENAATFMTDAGGWTDGRDACYRVRLLDAAGRLRLEKIALAVKPSEVGGAVQHRRYLVRGLAAGAYALKLAGYWSATKAATVHALAFDYVPNPPDETVVPVTGGDFEQVVLPKPFFASRDNNSQNNNPGQSWTLTNGGLKVNPAVQTYVNGMMVALDGNEGYAFQFRAHELGRYGDTALMWMHTNSTAGVRNTATSPATTLPAGTWRLRMRACRMTTGSNDVIQIAKDATHLRRCGKNLAVYAATVSVDGGGPVALGQTAPVDSFLGKDYFFPNAFTVADGASVVVGLDQLVGWSFSLVDDFEFVKVDLPGEQELGPELVQNGSFEVDDIGSGAPEVGKWSVEVFTDASGKKHGGGRLWWDSEFFGRTRGVGDYVWRAYNGGKAVQALDLDAGVYRLSYWSRARCDFVYGDKDGTPTNVGKMHFWYAAPGASVTNAIYDGDTLWCTNFYETTALFEVKDAGRYVLGFNPDFGEAVDSLTDGVSVRKVLGPARAPDIASDAELVLSSGNGGRVRLDFSGTLRVKALRANGAWLYGEVSSATHPHVFAGPGTVKTGAPPGLRVFIR